MPRLRKHVALRIDADSMKQLEKIAKREDDPVARIIRRAIAEFLERQNRKRK